MDAREGSVFSEEAGGRRFAAGQIAGMWNALVRSIGAAEAAWLVATIGRIDPPERIAALGALEKGQIARRPDSAACSPTR